MKTIAGTLIPLFILCVSSFAQSGGTFRIEKSVIVGGGGTSTGSNYSMTSTIGEAVAGVSSNGGSYSLKSGFLTEELRRSPFDFDGDGKTDIGIFRPAGSATEWWINRSGNAQTFALQFGATGDQPLPNAFVP